MFRRIFGRKKSAEGMIDQLFPAEHRAYAKKFYESWKGKEYLVVDLGDGDFDDLTSTLFYEAARFYFFSVPGEAGEYGVLGADMEDPLGMIAVRKEDGEILYLYDGTETSLATNIEGFITALRNAGWDGP